MIQGLSTIQVALIGAAAVALVGGVQQIRVLNARGDAREAVAESRGHELAAQTLRAEVRQGQQSMALCEAANRSRDEAIGICHAHTGDLARESRRLDAELSAARRKAREVVAVRDAEETEIRARPDAPTLHDALQQQRRRGEGWLWR